MPSEGTNQSRSSAPYQPTPGKPSSGEIVRNLELQSGDSPLDFIKNNTKPLPDSKPDVDPQNLANTIAVQKKEKELEDTKKAVADTQPVQPQSVQRAESEPQKVAVNAEDAPKVQPPSGTQMPAPETEEGFNPLQLVKDSLKKGRDAESPPSESEEVPTDDVQSNPEDSKEVNFKKLREVVKDTKKTLQEKEALLTETSEKLKKYESGEVVPETLQKQQARIAELERFEKIVSLKTSPQYQEKFIKPLESITNKLEVIAADYKIPPESLKGALSIKSQSELNAFLSDHFDGVGALEVKQLINQARELQDSAKAAENEPNTALNNLIEEGRRAETVRKTQQRQAIANKSQNAWMNSLTKIKEEGKILELIPKEGDSEYNEKYINPIIQAASSEYGKIVTMLAENGLTDLPEDVAYALSRLTQLAHASALSIESRKIALERAQTLETNTKRSTRYERPQIGSGYGKGSEPAPAPSSPRGAADQLLSQLGIGK